MKLPHLLLAVLCWMALPAGARAQRPEFARLQDSIANLSDVTLLRRMERAVAPAGAGRSLEPVVRLGLLELRLWELTGDPEDADRAKSTFEGAVERFPDRPWSHYGLALALALGPDVRLPLFGGVLARVTLGQTFAEVFKRDPASKARRELRSALSLDPAFVDAAVLLADLALADGRSKDLVREARSALERAQAAGSTSPRLARALADTETALGNYAAAARAAAAGGERDPGALRSRGIAQLLQPGQEASGYALYRRAVELLDAPTAEQLYQDLVGLLTPQEGAEWKIADTVAERRLWLERFWDRRAAAGGVTPGERVAEHYRRLAIARASYVRNARRGAENTGSLLGEPSVAEHTFDDRGIILIRHGLPLRVVSSTTRGLLPNETWVYDLPGLGPQLFHFVALRSAQDYSLVGDLLQALDPRLPLGLNERQRAVLTLLEDRALYEPGYRFAVSSLRGPLAAGEPLDGTEIRSVLERIDSRYRRGARLAIRTDTYERRFEGSLAFEHDLFTFRTPFLRTDLTAAFAIPAEQLEPLVGSGGTSYALRLSVILTDTLQDVVARVDTAETLHVAGPLGRDDYLRTFVTLPVVPSDHMVYRVVVEDAVGGRGTIEGGGTRLRDYSGNNLQVSDVVLALPDSAGEWRRGDVALSLALPRRFGPERPFTVFYELYNLLRDTPYSTEVTVEPTRRANLLRRALGLGPDRIRLRFDGVAQPGGDGVVQEMRRLASDLAPGSYRLEIVVTNRATGERASATTLFTVTG